MVVGTADEDVSEAGQFLADPLDRRQEQADHIPRRRWQSWCRRGQDDGPDHERLVDGRGLAVLAEAGDVDRLAAELGVMSASPNPASSGGSAERTTESQRTQSKEHRASRENLEFNRSRRIESGS